ncbi:MAG: T9SS type A sorting domain-containing protein [Ferruginibacter sp.]
MIKFYSPLNAIAVFIGSALWFKKYFLCLINITLCIAGPLFIQAQGITINPRTSLVLNGNITLVINNAPLKNNGTFTASTSTVKFSGNTDTLTAYVAGSKSTTFHNLSIIKSANGVALKSAVGVRNVLEVSGGNLYTDSNLTLKSDIALTARVDVVPATSQIIGKANVERYIPSRRAWRLLTAPLTNSNTIYRTWQNYGIYAAGSGTLVTGPNPTGVAGNGLDPSYYNNPSLKIWNTATQAFSNVANTHVPISSGSTGKADNTGYFVFVRGDRDPNNTIIVNTNLTTLNSVGTLQTGTQTFTATSTGNGYTLIGNPYASPIDFNKVSLTNLVKRFYIWDPKINILGGYVMMDDLDNDGIYATSILGSSQTKDIQSSQAFFVETKVNGAASLTFIETSKSGNNNNVVFRPLNPNRPTGSGIGQIRTNLYLVENDNTTILADGVFAEFSNIYSLQVDRDDALKFGNVNENLAIQRSTYTLAAERRPELSANDTVFFNQSRMVQRSYQFEFVVDGFEQTNLIGSLEDSYLNTSTPVSLSGTTSVNFTVDGNTASAGLKRFKLVFKAISTLPVTILDVAARQKNTDIMVEWKVENEINMLKYDVEKSTDSRVFTRATTINVSGAGNTYNSYSWLDVNAVQGNNFYRIKSYDRSGQTRYSSIVKVAIGKTEGGFSIYPNPIKGSVINLKMDNQPAGTYQVRLTNVIGQTLYVDNIKNNGGNNTQSLNTGSKLPAGIYQLEIIGQDNSHNTQKVIVE